MAAGKPVIVTDGGGSRELVLDGEQGFFVPVSEPAAVAERIEQLLDDSSRGQQMGAAGRRRLEECFSLEGLARNSLRMFEDVLAKAPRPNSKEVSNSETHG
jgi:glycosyltransferase involved in cell wall biosynthesis